MQVYKTLRTNGSGLQCRFRRFHRGIGDKYTPAASETSNLQFSSCEKLCYRYMRRLFNDAKEAKSHDVWYVVTLFESMPDTACATPESTPLDPPIWLYHVCLFTTPATLIASCTFIPFRYSISSCNQEPALCFDHSLVIFIHKST